MTTQKLGQYIVWGGYASGLVAVALSAHHIPILIAAGLGVAAVFIGRQMEKPAATPVKPA